MIIPLRLLLIDDSDDDVLVLLSELSKGGIEPVCKRIDAPAALSAALTSRDWDFIICEYIMPSFSGLEALRLVKESGLDIPFIIVSGNIGEETAVEIMKAGAHDYIVKGNLARLVPAIRREIEEAEGRRRRKQAEDNLRKRESELKEAQRLAQIGSWEWSAETNTVNWSEELYHIFGRNTNLSPPDNDEISRNYSPESWEKLKLATGKALKDGTPYALDVELVRPDGTKRWIIARGEAMHNSLGLIVGLHGTIQDITERKRYEEQLEYHANHDSLTGLPNRKLLADRITKALSYADRYRCGAAVLFIDLDEFKVVNDSLGHDAGDLLLKLVSERIQHCVRAIDTVARIGGDEFVVVLADIAEDEDSAEVAQRIQNDVCQPINIDGHKLFVSCSIGISIYPKDGEDAQTLLKNADVAIYRAKEVGRNNYQYYTAALNEKAVTRRIMEKYLRQALDRGEFLLHYQPKVDLASGRIIGMEALLRWQSPELGLVPPAGFIPIAEETGLVVPIGEWVMRTACAQSKAWQEAGIPPRLLAVNLSPRQFRQESLHETVALILHETGLDPHYLELEIIESTVMQDVERTKLIMRKLKGIGVQLTMDDFGTGYSSLSHLKRFQFDKIKIDRSFVNDITNDHVSAALTKTIIDMARNLNLRVTAEGVETEKQLEFLYSHFCNEMQGFYFSHPLPAESFELLLWENRRLPRSLKYYSPPVPDFSFDGRKHEYCCGN